MPFVHEYVVSAHPPLSLHSKVPRPWALDTYSTVHHEIEGDRAFVMISSKNYDAETNKIRSNSSISGRTRRISIGLAPLIVMLISLE